MDLKEFGSAGVLVIGGAVYGISQYGLNDVLSEELRHISEVSAQERPAYMNTVIAEFDEAFDAYGVETSTGYTFAGLSEFSTLSGSGTFVETVTQDSPVPPEEMKAVKKTMEDAGFCEQDEMTMFTDNGWKYRFSMKDSNGRKVYAVVCEPLASKLRGMS